MFKGQNGITLVALVITIVVLLILAGVTIATFTGDEDSIMEGANTAVTKYNAQAANTILTVNSLESVLHNYMSQYNPTQNNG